MSKNLTWDDAPAGLIVLAIISRIWSWLGSGSDCDRTATATAS